MKKSILIFSFLILSSIGCGDKTEGHSPSNNSSDVTNKNINEEKKTKIKFDISYYEDRTETISISQKIREIMLRVDENRMTITLYMENNALSSSALDKLDISLSLSSQEDISSLFTELRNARTISIDILAKNKNFLSARYGLSFDFRLFPQSTTTHSNDDFILSRLIIYPKEN